MEINKKLKICYVLNFFPVVSESWLVELMADLVKRGHELNLVVFNHGQKEALSDKIKNYQLMEKAIFLDFPSNKILRILFAVPKALKILLLKPALFKKLLNYREPGRKYFPLKYLYWCAPLINRVAYFDIFHCHYLKTANQFLILKNLLGIKQKVISTFHGYDVSGYINKSGKSICKDLIEKGDLFITVSLEMKERIRKLGFSDNKIKVLYLSIDLNEYLFKSKTYKSGELFKIICVARFVDKKGLEDLIMAASLLFKEYKNIELHMVGNGPNYEKIGKLATELGLDKIIRFHGLLQHDKVLKLLEKMHLFVLLSKTAQSGDMEGLPYSLLEAQACGLPVVSTDHSGIKEGVLEGQTGFIISQGDFRAAYEKIKFFIDNPKTLNKFSLRARKFIEENFDSKLINDKLIDIYRNILL